jgi:hypothetical protein
MKHEINVLEEAAWRPLYRLGAAAAALMLLLIPIQAAIYFAAPPPTTAREYFALFERSPLLGLLSLDLLYMVDIVLAGFLLTVIGVALRRVAPTLVLTALFLNVIATAMYFSSNPAFEMMTLSDKYAVAIESERGIFVSAGEAMLAGYTGSAYLVSYELAGLAGLLLAIAMLRSFVFDRVIAWLGLVMNILALVPPTAGSVGTAAALLFLVPFAVWLVLVARRLLRLARGTSPANRPIDDQVASRRLAAQT